MPRDRRAVIGTGIWGEPSIRLLTRLQQQAYQLALTQPDLNRCGVLSFRPRSWAQLAADATEQALRDDFRALHDTRHVILDETDDLLLIRTYVRHDGLLSQPLVVAAMVRDYFTITSPTIKTAFLAEIRRLFDLADLEDKDRTGLALSIGADPQQHGIRNAPQVGKAIGTGLAGPLVDAITRGHIPPFNPKGLPKGLTEGQQEGLTKGPPDPRPDPQENARTPVSVPVTVSVPTPVTVPAPNDQPVDDPTGALLAIHAGAYEHPPSNTVLAVTKLQIQRLIASGTPPAYIAAGLTKMRDRQLAPRLLPELVAECTPVRGRSTTTDRVATARAVADSFRDPGDTTKGLTA